MLTRTITGVLFVVVLIACTVFNFYSFAALFFVFTIVGLWEFYTLAKKGPNLPNRILGVVTGAVVFITSAFIAGGYIKPQMAALAIPFLFSIFITELYKNKPSPFRNIAYTILGVVYVALPFSMLCFIMYFNSTYEWRTLLGMFFLLWTNDTFAYLFGSWLGKTKLFERVSPKKSWEGSIGGGVSTLVIAFIISIYYTHLNLIDWMAFAVIIIVIGTIGDLVESLYKRSRNVKDSGKILPGHGGVLDRFDSMLMAIPFVFTYLYLVK